MFCPNCGANNTTEQKFCRSCGLNLEVSAASLLEQIPSAEAGKLLKREQKIKKFGNIAFGGFGLVVLIAIAAFIYLIVTKMILTGENVFAGILLCGFMIFAALALAYVGFMEDLKERKQKTNPALQNELAEPRDTGKFLEEKPFEPTASVTENTTDLLPAENKTRKFN